MKGVVFDFDGPIFDGRGACHAALTETFAHFEAGVGRPGVAVGALPLFGPSAIIALAYAELPGAQSELPAIREFYRARLNQHERESDIDERVRVLLRDLARRGIKRAVLSSRETGPLEALLARLRLSDAFDAVWGRDKIDAAKPDPAVLLELAKTLQLEPADLVVVGDSDGDYDVTKGTGAAYYHAAWTGEPGSRAFTGCRMLLHDVDDMTTVLRAAPPRVLSSHDEIPENLVDAIRAGRLVFYAGAGVSVPSGIGGWDDHYLPIVRRLRVGPWTEDFTMPELLQLVASDGAQSESVYQLFKQSFAGRRPEPNAYHYAMVRSGALHIWTTNYDQLFETTLFRGGFGHRVVKNDAELLDNFEHDRLIIKMNGDFEDSKYAADLEWGMVFLEQQFDLAERRRQEVWRLFEDDYRSSSIVFVGASFKDPALRRLLSNAAKSIPRTRFRHHLLVKAAEHPADRIVEAMQIEKLKRVNIDTHLLLDFKGIERWVQQVTMIAKRPIVGFSGTGKQEGGMLVPEGVLDGGTANSAQIEELCTRLGRALVQRGFRVTSGHGPCVGVPAVEAAFEADPTAARFYLRKRGSSQFRRTAPAVVVPGEDYGAMRERYVGELDLLIAIGGDHSGSGVSGTETEIDMAMRRSIPVLLIRQGGGAVLRAKPRSMQNCRQAYPDPRLADMVEAVNRELDSVEASDLPSYATAKLADRIADLVAVSLSAALRRPDEEKATPAQRQW